MAIESQGVKIHRLTTVYSALTSYSTIKLESTSIDSTRSTDDLDFLNKGFTTAMWVRYSTLNPMTLPYFDWATHTMFRIKSVAATRISIYGTHTSRAAVPFYVAGWPSTTIDELTDFSGPSGVARIIDATPINSTVTRIKTMMRQAGEISISMNFNSTATSQQAMRTDVERYQRRSYAIIFTDCATGSSAFPSWCDFSGYAINYSVNAAIDNKITANAIIAIDGEVRWSTKVNE